MNRRNQSRSRSRSSAPSAQLKQQSLGSRTQSRSSAASEQPSGSRIQSSTKESSGDKVLIVFSCYGRDGPSVTHRQYKFCVVDLNSSGKEAIHEGDVLRPISPTLQINVGRYVADISLGFCVFGETLYMFDGFDASSENNEKSIFTYDLSSLHNTKETDSLPTTTSLLKKDLTKVGEMRYPKDQPSAVLTPDGKKILLFPTKLRVSVILQFGGAFELYDPVEGISETLPLIDDIKKSDTRLLFLRTYGFISMFKFVVHIHNLGSYVIDLELRYKKRRWEKLNCFGNYVRCHQEEPFFMIEDRFLFTPRIVEHTSLVKNSSRIKSSQGVDDDDVLRGRHITLLKHDKDKGNCSFCLLYFEMHHLPSLQLVCNLYVDVYCASCSNKDNDETKEGEEKMVEEDQEGKEKLAVKDPVEIKLKSTRALRLTCEPQEDIFLFSPAFIFSL